MVSGAVVVVSLSLGDSPHTPTCLTTVVQWESLSLQLWFLYMHTQVINGTKSGRVGDEIIVVDLTGTGAQDAAIGQVAWEKLSALP